jgi:outer membrane protein
MKSRNLWLTAVVAALASASALAQQNTIKIGVANVQPHSSASDFTGNGPPGTTPAGISLEVQNKTTPYFSFSHEFNDHWDIELALGLPPTHDVTLKVNTASAATNAAYNGQKASTVRQLAPTVFANYKFLEKSSKIRPFVGAGINYTKFDDFKLTSTSNSLNCGGGTIPGCGTSNFSMSDSWGLALQAGATYNFTREWSLTGSVATAQVKSKITTNTPWAGGNIQRTSDIKFRPTVFTLALGYSF